MKARKFCEYQKKKKEMFKIWKKDKINKENNTHILSRHLLTIDKMKGEDKKRNLKTKSIRKIFQHKKHIQREN